MCETAINEKNFNSRYESRLRKCKVANHSGNKYIEAVAKIVVFGQAKQIGLRNAETPCQLASYKLCNLTKASLGAGKYKCDHEQRYKIG